jgi:hypothetical protein
VFATRSFHAIDGVPFMLFCDSFVLSIDRPTARALVVKLAGAEDCKALMALCPLAGKGVPRVRVAVDRQAVRARRRGQRREYRLSAGATVELTW